MTESKSNHEKNRDGLASNFRIGYWAAITAFITGILFLATVAAPIILGAGFPPTGVYLTLISIATLLAAVAMVFLWAAIHICSPSDRKIFSLCSLAMITILSALTGVTRFVQISLLPQAQAAGITEGLQWFKVYGEYSFLSDVEVLAWGGFLGFALLSLAPVFSRSKQERALFWSLIISGPLCLLGAVGKVLNMIPLIFVGLLGWGLGVTIAIGLLVFWFKRKAVTA